MGRGRKSLLCQGKNLDNKANKGGYLFLSDASDKTKKEPMVLPSSFIDRLKQMDPKTVADLLLK